MVRQYYPLIIVNQSFSVAHNNMNPALHLSRALFYPETTERIHIFKFWRFHINPLIAMNDYNRKPTPLSNVELTVYQHLWRLHWIGSTFRQCL